METMCQGAIIAVDAARHQTLRPSHGQKPGWWRRLFVSPDFDGLSISNLLLSGALASSEAQAKLSRQNPDVLLELPLTDITMLDWKALDRAAEAGYRHTMARMEEVKRVAAQDY
jgi:predicted acylesterase/phospholipase RssA